MTKGCQIELETVSYGWYCVPGFKATKIVRIIFVTIGVAASAFSNQAFFLILLWLYLVHLSSQSKEPGIKWLQSLQAGSMHILNAGLRWAKLIRHVLPGISDLHIFPCCKGLWKAQTLLQTKKPATKSFVDHCYHVVEEGTIFQFEDRFTWHFSVCTISGYQSEIVERICVKLFSVQVNILRYFSTSSTLLKEVKVHYLGFAVADKPLDCLRRLPKYTSPYIHRGRWTFVVWNNVRGVRGWTGRWILCFITLLPFLTILVDMFSLNIWGC